MTDEAYCLRQDERERKTLARMSRYKKSGSRTNYVRLPQTYMTDKELAKMNGKVYTLTLSKPMSKDEFKALTIDLQREYLINLAATYKARQIDVARMFGYSQNGFCVLTHKLLGNKANPFMTGKKPAKEWLEFIGQTEAPSQADTAVDFVEPVPEEKPKPKDVLAFDSISLRFSGTPADILAAIAKTAVLLDGEKRYHVSFNVDQLYESAPLVNAV